MKLFVLAFILIPLSACGGSPGGVAANATQTGTSGAPASLPPSTLAGGGGTRAAVASAGVSGSTLNEGPNPATFAAAGGGGGGSGSSAQASGPATFTRVWSEVLERKGCSGQYCHGSGQGGLKFASQAEAYTALVNVAAAGPKCATSGLMRVKPSDSANSLLVEKLSKATPACGDMMPIGAKLEPDCLSMNPSVCNTQAEISLVKQWIDAGAKND